MPIPLFTNNAATALAVAITPTDTVLQITAGTGSEFPSPTGGNYFMLTLVQINNPEVAEIVKCIGRTGDFLTVERGQENTQPQIFNISDNVQLRITAQSLNLFAQGGGGGGGGAATQVVEFTATQGQTVFTIPFSYVPDNYNLAVFVNGSKQIIDVNYSESSSTSITFFTGLNVGDLVEVIYNLPIAAGQIDASNILYDQGGIGAVESTVQKKLQESVSVKDFGAIGDGVTDDTAAINTAVTAAAGKALFFPSGTYLTTTGINYTATSPINIYGSGPGSVIKFTGTTGAAIYITGTPGVTNASLIISDLKVTTGSNTAQAGIWLYGIAVYSVHDVYVMGNFSYGVRFSAAQQGEYSGGQIQAINGVLFEDVGAVSSNACDFHGVSLFCDTTNITFNCTSYEDSYINGNHLAGANGIAILNSGTGTINIVGNHIENNDAGATNYGIKVFAGRANIVNNNIPANPNLGIILVSSNLVLIDGNAIAGGINIGSGSAATLVTNNAIFGGITNASSTSNFLNNRDNSGNPIDIASKISSNKLTVESTNTTPGLIADFRANQSYGGRWGINVQGSGAYVPYVSFNGGPGVGGYSTTVSLYTDVTASPVVSGYLTTYFAPGTDNITASGWSTNRWTVIYATTGTINTSDANEKQQIRSLSAAEKATALTIKSSLKAFKFNDAVEAKGNKARIHIGVIAQDVQAAFIANGLNADDYGLFCSDTLEDGSTRLGVRYEELLAFVLSAI